MPQHASVVIVGAGLAGLTTALALHRAGVDVLVVEAAAVPGGRIATVTFPDGATAEIGAQEFWSGGAAYPLLTALELPMVTGPGRSSMIIDGELHEHGRRSESALAGFTALTALVDRYRRAPASAPHDLTIQELIYAEVGHAPAAAWAQILVEIETAFGWDDLAAADGIAELAPFFGGENGLGQPCGWVAGGNAAVVRALIDRLPADAVQYRTSVRRIADGRAGGSRPGDGRSGVTISGVRDGGRDWTATADHVVVAVPPWRAVEIDLDLRTTLPIRHALSSIGTGGYLKVVLRLRSEFAGRWAEHGAELFPLLTDSAAGCLYLDDPGDGRDLLLTALVPQPRVGALFDRPPAVAVSAIVRTLEQLPIRTGKTGAAGAAGLFAGLAAHVTDHRVYPHPQAVTRWSAQLRRSRFDPLSAMIRRPHGRVHLAGDGTECCHTDGAVASAGRVVGQILGLAEDGIRVPA